MRHIRVGKSSIPTEKYIMKLTPDQILTSQKAHVETLIDLTHKAFEGLEKLIELNMSASKAALADAEGTARAALNAKDAQELLALQAGLLQPLAEKTAAYSRRLYEIAQGTGTEFGKAFEAKTREVQQTFADMVDNASKNAPAGSEAAMAVFKGAVTAASNAFESVHKAVKQAADAAGANFNAAADTTVNAAKNATAKHKH
jgi:phasin family protein